MSSQSSKFSKPTPTNGERHTLLSETELRLEVPQDTTVVITLLEGSAEIFGSELTLLTLSNAPSTISNPMNLAGTGASSNLNQSWTLSKQSHVITGHAKFAIFTWHGCTIDIDVEFGKSLDISYTSDETVCNIVYVNTHAQLEAMRDETLGAYLDPNGRKAADPPRVLVVGPRDSGKTSLVKVLTAYAVKLGRNPLLVDLDVSQNMLSIPGTITASTMTIDNISPQSYASSSSILPNTNTLAFWYGSTDLSTNPDLYKSFLDKMGQCIDARLSNGRNDNSNNNSNNNGNANPQENQLIDAKSSGIIVNGCGWIEDMGYELMKHTIQALHINVVLVMGHDRLYSMLSTNYNKMREQKQNGDVSIHEGMAIPKVIKLARSGGIVSRDSSFRRVSRSLSMKQYFYGESIVSPSAYGNVAASLSASGSMLGGAGRSNGLSVPTSSLVNQFSPALIELSFADVTIYKMDNVSLSASMLPVSAKQTSEVVQLNQIHDIGITLKHSILAVCHPMSVEKYEQSGEPSDLYMTGVTGFVVVEKVDVNREIISLLSPCSGALASSTLLAADVTWRE